MKKRGKAAYMISNVAQNYSIHPQTLRLYERQGLLKPSRSEGNTRLYTDEDLERLELILTLTRDLGVNLAGVEIILNMRDKMMEMQKEFGRFIEMIHNEFSQVSSQYRQKIDNALVPTPPQRIIRLKRPPSS
jgi:MerR family transcriptional regulator/heat shock protein HspR